MLMFHITFCDQWDVWTLEICRKLWLLPIGDRTQARWIRLWIIYQRQLEAAGWNCSSSSSSDIGNDANNNSITQNPTWIFTLSNNIIITKKKIWQKNKIHSCRHASSTDTFFFYMNYLFIFFCWKKIKHTVLLHIREWVKLMYTIISLHVSTQKCWET